MAIILSCSGMDQFVLHIDDYATLLQIFCAGAVAATSFVMVAEAYRCVDATALAPFQYLEIVTGTALGFLVFGDFPDTLIWIGVAIILGSGIYIFHRAGQSETSAPRRKRAGR